MISSNGTPPVAAEGLLAALLGIQPDVLQAPPLPLAPRQTQAIRAAPPKNAPKPVPPTPALMKVLRFIAELAPGSGEGIAAAELLKASKKGKAGDAVWAALGLVPVVGDAAKAVGKGAKNAVKAAPKVDLDAIMYTPETGFFEGIKGNKMVVSGRYDPASLQQMLGPDVFQRLVNSPDELGVLRLDARAKP